MAMMADNVPAVQALGQCIFLPMLVIGGIAVPLASLPDWAQHVSAFFPGRYAVGALQACVIGNGLGAARFDLLALLIIGAGGCVAGAKMFRWDAQQRFAARSGKGWVTVALLSWCIVGVMSEYRGRTLATRSADSARQAQTGPESTPALPSASAPPVSVAAPEAPPPAPVTLSKAERNAVQTDAAPQLPPPRPSGAATTGPAGKDAAAESKQTSWRQSR